MGIVQLQDLEQVFKLPVRGGEWNAMTCGHTKSCKCRFHALALSALCHRNINFITVKYKSRIIKKIKIAVIIVLLIRGGDRGCSS